MYNIEDSILDISNNYYEYLMSLYNVNGIGMGYKYINGVNTKQLCIHVLVEEKVNSKYISKSNIIPKKYMGITTDVIEVKKVKALSRESLPYKIRPLEGGYGISTTQGDGTLGCIVKAIVNGRVEFYILGNNHVMARLNKYPLGAPIMQPSLKNGGTVRDNRIAELSDYVKIKFKNFFIKRSNVVDCAIARIFDRSLISDRIAKIGQITGVARSNLDMKVKKVGFITGLTEGKVTSVGATYEVGFSESKKKAIFKNQLVAELANEEGDSGSIVLNELNEAVGLLFSGSGKYAIYNDMEMVLYKLNVDLLYKKIPKNIQK